jgi:phasin family protein
MQRGIVVRCTIALDIREILRTFAAVVQRSIALRRHHGTQERRLVMATQQTTQQTKQTGASERSAPTPSLQDALKAGQEQVVTAVKTGQDVLAQNVDTATEIARTQIGKSANALLTNSTDATNFTKSQVDAVVAASTNVVEGVESLNRELVNYTQQQLDSHVEMTRKAFGVASVRELVDLQQDFARQSVDGMLNQSAKMTELMMKMANDALQPLQTQASSAMARTVTTKTAA